MKTKMTQEEMVAAANKWMALEAIREAYGLDRELEDIAYLLLAKGGRDEEVLRSIECVERDAGQVTECERRVKEDEEKLQYDQHFLDHAVQELEYSRRMLRSLMTRDDDVAEALEEVAEAVAVEADELSDDFDLSPDGR